MELKLKRCFLSSEYTIGTLYVDGDYFCDTLEDAVRENKIVEKTAIPFGRYEVILNHSPRFNCILPIVLNVPNFEGIRIHAGNTSKDTQGCILVGKNKEKGKVLESRKTLESLVKLMLKKSVNQEKIFIEIK